MFSAVKKVRPENLVSHHNLAYIMYTWTALRVSKCVNTLFTSAHYHFGIGWRADNPL
jgi:hypothetical protein